MDEIDAKSVIEESHTIGDDCAIRRVVDSVDLTGHQGAQGSAVNVERVDCSSESGYSVIEVGVKSV